MKCLLAVSVAFALWSSAAPAPAAQSAEAFANLTDDGGWCWFSDPRAISRDGKTYTGWVTANGSIQAAQLDHSSGAVSTFTLHPRFERDDHDNPAFLFLPDGRLMAFYTRHGGGKSPGIQTRTLKSVTNFNDWEPELTLPLRDGNDRHAGMSYCNPFLLSGEGNTIYLFWRGLSYKPTMAKSTDGGKTWSDAQVVFSLPGLPEGNRPYAKYTSNGKDRIHLLFTDGHPRNEPSNSVYYVCYHGGAFYKADGTRICGVNDLPIRPEQADCVYNAKQTGARAWIWSVAFDNQDRPVIAYTRLPKETDHRYHYARWDGKSWTDTEICAGGGWFPQTPPGQTEREPHYSSGLTLDPVDPSIVYLTRPVNGVRELEKWTTSDGGKTWQTDLITRGSQHDNIRPVAVLNPTSEGPSVLWQNLSGHYTHFTDYRSSIKTDWPSKAIPSTENKKSFAPLSPAIERKSVLEAMERVADWQIAHPGKHKFTDWTQGALFTGIMALDKISPSPRFREEMKRIGDANDWKLGPRKQHADDHAVGQTYAELFLRYKDEYMLAPMRMTFDEILSQPPKDTNLKFRGEGAGGLWSWCDSLFMAPPAWARLAAATGNARYLDYAITNWWHTSDTLYDKDEHLYYRDTRYFTKREDNGAKVFWSRGNGWVMGGLVRMMQYIPKDDPRRAKFEQQFKEISAKILALQQTDGLWRSSLLDAQSYPLKETSGSGFYTYALAWGVNEGLLDRAQYEPAIRKAWTALVECVTPEGQLTHVQPIGADPKKFDQNATEVYGVGAFLLAGSEVHRLAKN
ncbi:MAG: Unsaturated rhamnogalacturonyl hydrolase YteR [Verrucomicrobiota bacterium]|jgi:rhamnogalacturonyl hydrolase YesR